MLAKTKKTCMIYRPSAVHVGIVNLSSIHVTTSLPLGPSVRASRHHLRACTAHSLHAPASKHLMRCCVLVGDGSGMTVGWDGVRYGCWLGWGPVWLLAGDGVRYGCWLGMGPDMAVGRDGVGYGCWLGMGSGMGLGLDLDCRQSVGGDLE